MDDHVYLTSHHSDSSLTLPTSTFKDAFKDSLDNPGDFFQVKFKLISNPNFICNLVLHFPYNITSSPGVSRLGCGPFWGHVSVCHISRASRQ